MVPSFITCDCSVFISSYFWILFPPHTDTESTVNTQVDTTSASQLDDL